MSMNIAISAVREINYKDLKGNLKQDIQKEYFNAQQTPSNISYMIIGADDREAAYKSYISSLRTIEHIPVYAEDDYMEEGQPVEYVEYCFADEHIKDFNIWMNKMVENGYTIEWEVW